MCLSQDETLLAACGDHGLIRIWEAATGRLVRLIEDSSSGTWYDCSFGPGSRYLVTVGEAGRVRVWDVSTGRLHAQLELAEGSVFSCAVSGRGDWIASAGYDGKLRIWDANDFRLRSTSQVGTGGVYSCCADPAGTWVATAGEDRVLRVWSAASGSLQQEAFGHTGYLGTCAATADGSSIVTAGDDRTVRIWDVSLDGSPAPITRTASPQVGCSAVGRLPTVATAGQDGQIELRHRLTGAVLRSFGSASCLETVTMTLEGDLIAAAGSGDLVGFWKATDGSAVRSLKAHRGWVMSCGFDASGKRLITAGIDGAVRLWEVASGRLANEFMSGTWAVTECSAVRTENTLRPVATDQRSRYGT